MQNLWRGLLSAAISSLTPFYWKQVHHYIHIVHLIHRNVHFPQLFLSCDCLHGLGQWMLVVNKAESVLDLSLSAYYSVSIYSVVLCVVLYNGLIR